MRRLKRNDTDPQKITREHTMISKITFYRDRCETIAKYLISENTTVRAAAQYFGLSKSTIHKDVTSKLPHVNPPLYAAVRQLLDKNKSERHIRGGQATKLHYIASKTSNKNKQ